MNACTLLSAARASTLVGKHYTAGKAQTIAPGQDQCTYNATDDSQALTVTVYQPGSGVTFAMMKTVQAGVGTVRSISGTGQMAIAGSIDLDVEAGNRLLEIEGAGGTLTGNTTRAVAVANAVIAALP